MRVDVADHASALEYVATVDGERAGHIRYTLGDGVVTMVHTEVEPKFEHQGVGSELVRQALEDVRANGKKVLPLCPFVRSFVGEHDQYRDLVQE